MSLEITEMFDGIKNGTIELQTFHDWLCEPYTKLSDEEIYECWEKAGWHKESCIDEDLKFARAIETKVRGE